MAQIRSDVANISRSGDHELARSWAARILYVNGVPFVTCDRLDRGFCRYIRNRFHMTKHMKELRDMKVNALIEGLRAVETENRADPLASAGAMAERLFARRCRRSVQARTCRSDALGA